MNITTPESARQNALPSTITPEELGRIISLVDWQRLPPENRWPAQKELISRIMVETLIDRQKAREIFRDLQLHEAIVSTNP